MKEYRNKKGYVIGTLKDGKFRKKVVKDRHLFKIFDAWGIDSQVVEDLKKEKTEEIRILETTEDVVYSVPLEQFIEHSVEKDFGDGKQLFVSRKFFTATPRHDTI
jgi:hypothetical protein